MRKKTYFAWDVNSAVCYCLIQSQWSLRLSSSLSVCLPCAFVSKIHSSNFLRGTHAHTVINEVTNRDEDYTPKGWWNATSYFYPLFVSSYYALRVKLQF